MLGDPASVVLERDRQAAADKGFAAGVDLIQQFEEALAFDVGKRVPHRFSDQTSLAEEFHGSRSRPAQAQKFSRGLSRQSLMIEIAQHLEPREFIVAHDPNRPLERLPRKRGGGCHF